MNLYKKEVFPETKKPGSSKRCRIYCGLLVCTMLAQTAALTSRIPRRDSSTTFLSSPDRVRLPTCWKSAWKSGTTRLGLKSVSASEPVDSKITVEDTGLILPSHPEQRIKSVMAPMVAASDFPFRHFLQQHCGVDLVYTQMLHSKNFVTQEYFRRAHLDLFETGTTYPDLTKSQLSCLGDLAAPSTRIAESVSAPLMVQIAGSEVDVVVEAANMIMEHTNGRVSGFDLNCGCPQGIAKKGNYGAFLMERDSDRVCQILKALRASMPSHVAVSAKIRLPTDDQTLKERIAKLLDTGMDFMTIHGRTIHENKTKVGACHIDRIRLAAETAHKMKPNFPIIANGGIEDHEDVDTLMKLTGAVAAMSSEALLETPNLFTQSSKNLKPRERLQQQISFTNDYLDICATVAPPLPGVLGLSKGGSMNVVKGHMFKFLHRYLCEQPDLRERQQTVCNIGEARSLVDELYGRYDTMSDETLEVCGSSRWENSWYRRHRKPDRRVHERGPGARSSLYGDGPANMTPVERKIQIRERLKAMREQKNEKKGKLTFI